MTSYQNKVLVTQADEETAVVTNHNDGPRRRSIIVPAALAAPTKLQKVTAAMILGSVFLVAALTTLGGEERVGSYRSADLVTGGSSPPDRPLSPNDTYDWKKCLGSDDPDCWKTEGKKQASIWKSFGETMSAFGATLGLWHAAKATAADEKDEGGNLFSLHNSAAATAAMAATAAPPANARPMPEYDFTKDLSSKEAVYDWKKCVGSTDPDCWAKESHRGDTFWHSFGETMSAYGKDLAVWHMENKGQPAASLGASATIVASQADISPKAASASTFDWQKCIGSEDPDCWKKEGLRQATHWESFAEKFWNKEKNMVEANLASFLGGASIAAPPAGGTSTPEEGDPTAKGPYNWQKCIGSPDPDCWKKEGARQATVWESFAEKFTAYGKDLEDFLNNDDAKRAPAPKLASFLGASIVAPPAAASDSSGAPNKKSMGPYDWQKCLGSADPDCWKTQGKELGLEMKAKKLAKLTAATETAPADSNEKP